MKHIKPSLFDIWLFVAELYLQWNFRRASLIMFRLDSRKSTNSMERAVDAKPRRLFRKHAVEISRQIDVLGDGLRRPARNFS